MAHRFSVKYVQSLPKRTNSDLALSLMNLLNSELEIDYRKHVFQGVVQLAFRLYGKRDISL